MKHKLAVVVAALTTALTSMAWAQGVYRIVGPDGRVTFSDTPPATAAAPATRAATGAPSGSASQPLPFELRQTATRYPVTLYTSDECAPCNTGRNLLNARGIPYRERTVTTAEDVQALQRLANTASLPVLTVGAQQLKGFSDTEWTQFLDAAGYPKQSALPVGYRRPAATPLVAVVEAPAAPAAAGAGTAAGTPPPAVADVPVQPPVTNPAGIRF